jgi:hypothetical protein
VQSISSSTGGQGFRGPQGRPCNQAMQHIDMGVHVVCMGFASDTLDTGSIFFYIILSGQFYYHLGSRLGLRNRMDFRAACPSSAAQQYPRSRHKLYKQSTIFPCSTRPTLGPRCSSGAVATTTSSMAVLQRLQVDEVSTCIYLDPMSLDYRACFEYQYGNAFAWSDADATVAHVVPSPSCRRDAVGTLLEGTLALLKGILPFLSVPWSSALSGMRRT